MNSQTSKGRRQSQLTTDKDKIREWSRTHNAVPVRYTGDQGGSEHLRIIPENVVDETTHERLEWDEFFHEIDEQDMVVIYYGEEQARSFEVISQNEATGRTTGETEKIEEALLQGETVESEITETTVIERTVVEEVTVESEITNREVIEEDIITAELITRNIEQGTVSEIDTDERVIDPDQFKEGHKFDDRLHVEVDVDEGWSLTREILERLTIESRVVDTDVSETEEIEADTVDLEGVQWSLVEGNLLDSDVTADEVIEGEAVRSEFGDGDVIHTYLLERKTIDEELTVRKRYTGEISEGETLDVETIRRTAIESELIGDTDEIETAADTPEGAESDAGDTVTEADVETAKEETGVAGETSAVPTMADEGKAVVDAAGEKVGMVVDVEGSTIYVDPHPSLADKIKTALGWSDRKEDDYPIESDRIMRITDDRVELSVKK